MFDVFVSYRSLDARFGAAATYELLANRFSRARIFLDNQSMGPGAVYPQELRDALESVKVLVALIGPQWLAEDPPGQLLIHRHGDWVRREISRAFARGIPVIPVLLDGARLPPPEVLPEDVQPLVFCQTVEVRHRHLGADVGRLAEAVSALLDAPTGDGQRWPRVRDIDDPVLLGVHPSPARSAMNAGVRVPEYVRRDAADRLRWALSETSFVLLVGDATAGKSRLAYEVIRQELPDHRLVAPDGPDGLADALAWVQQAGECVVWLDDIERYLGPDGLTVSMVSELVRRKTTLVGTIRSHEHARLSPRWQTSDEGEPGRQRRDVLRLAHEIHVSRQWSEAETERAMASTDPRVTEAARHAHECGVAEYLAAGPQLLAEWRDAWSPGTHPRAAALVAAAVDAFRAGVIRGLSVDLLRRLHGNYLAARGGATLRPEPFDEALSWATETLHATSSLLVPTERNRYRPFGYLVDNADGDPEHPTIPENTWQTLVARIAPASCWRIGESAYARRQLSIARSAFDRAAAAGNPSAELRVVDCVGESGARGEALAMLQDMVTERASTFGPLHPDTMEARQALAGWTGRAGDPLAAAHLQREVVDDLTSTLGLDHTDTLAARHSLANWLGRAGRLFDAITEYRQLVDARTQCDGPEHPDTLTARHDLANWLGRVGNLEEAWQEHEKVAAARARVLGVDHPDTLRSRHRLARLACQVRGADVGLPLLDQVVTDRERVLGPNHPDSLRSRSQYIRWTGKAGRVTDAVAMAQQLARDSARALGPDHPDVLRARHLHARWTSETGDYASAVALLRDLIDDWERLLDPAHPYTLVSKYRLAVAVAGTQAWPEAIALLSELLDSDVTVLGEHHPYTEHARALLVQWNGMMPSHGH